MGRATKERGTEPRAAIILMGEPSNTLTNNRLFRSHIDLEEFVLWF